MLEDNNFITDDAQIDSVSKITEDNYSLANIPLKDFMNFADNKDELLIVSAEK